MSSAKNKRVVITGAGSGLGRELALSFARDGWQVAVADLLEEKAQETAHLVTKLGARVFALHCDVRSEESLNTLAADVAKEWGGFDVWINNAGVATAGTVEESPLTQWNWVLDINLLGCVRGSKAAISVLQKQKSGHIVNIASFAGIANPPAMASYNAAKAAVISLSESLRFEMAPHNVGVSVACPSFFKTDLLESGRGTVDESAQSSAPQMQKIVGRLMEKATVTSQDVAEDILDAVKKKRFMVITHKDARLRANIKRASPELFFRLAQRATAKFLQAPKAK